MHCSKHMQICNRGQICTIIVPVIVPNWYKYQYHHVRWKMEEQDNNYCSMTDKKSHDEWFVERMPKLELHAHLNGCIRPSTLVELSQGNVDFPESRTLEGCFQLFDALKTYVNSLSIVRRLTWEALQDFADQNVAYVELRSTPKNFSNQNHCKSNKRQYIQTILDVMAEFELKESKDQEHNKKHRFPLIPRYIVSIDRSGSLQDALEHVQLAIEFHKSSKYIVGVELSGNPTKNDFNSFEPAFHLARQSALSVSLHCGEIPCQQTASNGKGEISKKAFDEAKSIINFAPDRLGHAIFLPDSVWEKIYKNKEKQIPIECCPTSNVLTTSHGIIETNENLTAMCLKKQHEQLSSWIEQAYPFSINTDDPGIFDTNSTKEYRILMKAFKLSTSDLTKIVIQSIDHIFDIPETKLKLKSAFQAQISFLQNSTLCS